MNAESASNLKTQAANSAFWSLIEKIGIQGLAAVVGLFMTRLLLPADYGLVAMLDIFIAVGLLISDCGLGQAYIHKQETESSDASSIFLFNAAAGIILYVFIFLISKIISDFYSQPQLLAVCRVLSLNIPIQAMGLVHQSKLMKEFRLQILTKIKITSLIISGTLGIFLSLKGWGVWALVYYITAFSTLNTLSLWIFAGINVRTKLRLSTIRSYFNYSSKILYASLLDSLYTNFFTMLISKVYQVVTGGLYSKARLLQNIPVISATQIIQSVSFPLLSKIQHDAPRFNQAFKKQVRVLSFLMSFIMGIMVLTAKPFIILVLTEKWLPMLPYFQLLCALGWILPFHSLHSALLNSKGRSDLSLRLEIIKKAIAISGLIISIPFGVEIIIMAQIAAAVLGLILHMIYSKRLTGYTISEQMKDLIPPLFASAFIIGAILAFNIFTFSNIILFLTDIALASALYYLAGYFMKFNEFMFIKNILFNTPSQSNN